MAMLNVKFEVGNIIAHTLIELTERPQHTLSFCNQAPILRILLYLKTVLKDTICHNGVVIQVSSQKIGTRRTR